MRRVPVIDCTGLKTLRDLNTRCRREGTMLILSGVHSQPVIALTNSPLYEELGEDNITGHLDDALNRARLHPGLSTAERPAFATATVARETAHGERRKQPRL
jgi:SulP family sulfate permease